MQSLPPLDLEAVKRCLKDGCNLQVRGERVIIVNRLGDAAGETSADVFGELIGDGIIKWKTRQRFNDIEWTRKAEDVASV